MVAATYKQTDIGNIPNDWGIGNMFDNSTLKARIGWQGLTTAEYLDSGNYFLVTGTDFFDGKIKWETCHYVEEERYTQDKNIQLKLNDILVTKDGTIGKVAIVDKIDLPATLNSGVFVVRPKKNSYDPQFLFYVLKSSLFDDFLNQLVAGSTIQHLYQKDFVHFKFPIPPLHEQQLIAQVLSNTDALITNLQQLIAKKQQIKQGAMQQLLQPKEGWVVKKLGDVCDIKKGQLITDSTRVNGDIPVIAGGKSPAYYHNKANRNCKTITISGSGANAGFVAFHNYPIFASDCSTIEEHKDYSIEYVFYLLQSLQERIYKMQTGGAQPHIHPSDINPIELSFPQKEEQKEIAATLSDMDNEIESLEQNLSKYKMLKQGMMQELLTGKIRLV